jgi:hypothetical protein
VERRSRASGTSAGETGFALTQASANSFEAVWEANGRAASAERNGTAGAGEARVQRWPVLGEDAYQGLPGHIVREIQPHTEADPVAVLISLLSAFGNACGRAAFLRVGADQHHPKINAVLVGETSKGRKGMSWGFVWDLMHAVDCYWAEERVENGLSSGEGLIYQVRDKRMSVNKDGDTVVDDPGADDKRLFVLEGEFAGVLKVATREGNTLSAIIRTAWDVGKLSTLTKNSPMKATGSHVSVVGHVTKTELVRLLSDSDVHNGFANRFLWVCVKRSRILPFGGQWARQNVAPMVSLLGEVLRFAKSAGEMCWGDSAKPLWTERYPNLSEGAPGLLGAVTSRSEAQVLRLACVYALMNCSATIELEHLKAALGVWDYAEASARYVFGDATGDVVADRIEEMLSEAPMGLTRAEIRNAFGRNKSSERIGQALDLLERHGRVRKEIEPSGGRPAERWLIT